MFNPKLLINAVKQLSKTTENKFVKNAPKKETKKSSKRSALSNTLLKKYKKENKQNYFNKKIKNATKINPNDFFSFNKANFINTYEHTFDSKLEFYCYHCLILNKITFNFKPKYLLQDKVMNNKKVAVRAITISPDFEKTKNGVLYIFDTKGRMTEPSKLRFKMLASKLSKEGVNHEIVFLKNPKEVTEFLRKLK